jgi:tetrahydrodipicolinate N-succinyltransferase
METIRKFLADETGADDAKAEIGAAVGYLLKDATDSARGDIVREIIEIVHDVANGLLLPQHPNCLDARALKQTPMSGITYKVYVIDAFQRDTDKWRATIRRLDSKKIRVAVPPSVRDEFTTSADALTAEKAVELAKKAIDGGGVI